MMVWLGARLSSCERIFCFNARFSGTHCGMLTPGTERNECIYLDNEPCALQYRLERVRRGYSHISPGPGMLGGFGPELLDVF